MAFIWVARDRGGGELGRFHGRLCLGEINDGSRRRDLGHCGKNTFGVELLRCDLAQGNIGQTEARFEDEQRARASQQLPDTEPHHVDEEAAVRDDFEGLIEKNAIHMERKDFARVVTGLLWGKQSPLPSRGAEG